MLIVVPLLNINETDNTQSLAVELLQRMAVYNANNSSAYGVCRLLHFINECHILCSPSSPSYLSLYNELRCFLPLNTFCLTGAQAGLELTLDNIVANTKVLSVQINERSYVSNPYRISELRSVEQAYYTTSSDGVRTTVIYDNLSENQAEARFSMYTTLFVTFLLVVSTILICMTDR